jgi:hypothetical protein
MATALHAALLPGHNFTLSTEAWSSRLAAVSINTGLSSKFKFQIPWPLVRERTIPTERPPLVDEIWCQLLRIEGCRVVSAADPLRSLISVFYTDLFV